MGLCHLCATHLPGSLLPGCPPLGSDPQDWDPPQVSSGEHPLGAVSLASVLLKNWPQIWAESHVMAAGCGLCLLEGWLPTGLEGRQSRGAGSSGLSADSGLPRSDQSPACPVRAPTVLSCEWGPPVPAALVAGEQAKCSESEESLVASWG